MTRISLVEQYDNRSVIEQIHGLKGSTQGWEERIEEVEEKSDEAYQKADEAYSLASGMGDRLDAVESGLADIERELPDFELLENKDEPYGYIGADGSAKVPTGSLHTGVSPDQLLMAGTQLLDNEILYVQNGKIRSKPQTTSGGYRGRFPTVASLPSDASNGDYAAVYADTTSANNGFWMWAESTHSWGFVLLFDVSDYQLVANLIDHIDADSDNAHYTTAKAVFDLGELKQDKLSGHQMDAVNSGVTADILDDIDDNISDLISNKQDKLTTTQMNAVNSGITVEILDLLNAHVSSLENNKLDKTKINHETWVFTLEGGGQVTKEVALYVV